MPEYAYFKFSAPADWPADHPVQDGAIVRQSILELHPLVTDAWNEASKVWAHGKWSVTTNPALATPEGNKE